MRTSAEVRQLATALAAQPGNSAKVAQKLLVVLAGASAAAATATKAAVTSAVTAASDTLEDLLQGPGGRHDNDKVDYRCAHVPVAPGLRTCACVRTRRSVPGLRTCACV